MTIARRPCLAHEHTWICGFTLSCGTGVSPVVPPAGRRCHREADTSSIRKTRR